MQNNLANLKRQLAGCLHGGAGSATADSISLGCDDIDRALDNGLMRSALHEAFAAQATDTSAAAGFVAGLALRACAKARKIVWLRQTIAEMETGSLYAPGLAEFGLDPRTLIVVRARDLRTLLGAGLEAVRCASLGAVVIEAWRNSKDLNLTATRRLALAAETSGVTPFLLRVGADPGPSVAVTRWQVGTASSRSLAANAPGAPTFDITLVRNRAGASGQRWRVEWDHERCQFRSAAPLSGGVVSVSVRPPPQATGRPLARLG